MLITELLSVRSVEEDLTDCRYISPHESPISEVYLFIPEQHPLLPFWSPSPTPFTFRADGPSSIAGTHAQM